MAHQLARRHLSLRANLTVIFFSLALVFAARGQIDIDEAEHRLEAEVEANIIASHPAVYYAYAKRLFNQG